MRNLWKNMFTKYRSCTIERTGTFMNLPTIRVATGYCVVTFYPRIVFQNSHCKVRKQTMLVSPHASSVDVCFTVKRPTGVTIESNLASFWTQPRLAKATRSTTLAVHNTWQQGKRNASRFWTPKCKTLTHLYSEVIFLNKLPAFAAMGCLSEIAYVKRYDSWVGLASDSQPEGSRFESRQRLWKRWQ